MAVAKKAMELMMVLFLLVPIGAVIAIVNSDANISAITKTIVSFVATFVGLGILWMGANMAGMGGKTGR